MHRRHTSWVLVVALLLIGTPAAIAKSYLPTANTRAAIKAYVKSAAKVVAKSGPSCDTFKSADWMGGDYYIFVTGPDEKAVCHPNASMVGRDTTDIVDANGTKIGMMFIAASKKKGGGWVEYVWPRPGQTTPVKKSSYATRVKAPDGKWYIVGAGGYELK
ncbi:MAG TPA: cache domain-containing protein [Thermoanaerobaculia bacterium]|jgi:methyl-accepting chemotaxis protein